VVEREAACTDTPGEERPLIERGIEGQLERGGAGEGLAAGRDQPLLSTAVLARWECCRRATYRALVVRQTRTLDRNQPPTAQTRWDFFSPQ
jgi:hypothetical protein